MSESTALRFMQTADVFVGKSVTVTDLPPTILYQLAAPSTPEPIREDFMREAEATGSAPPPDLITGWRGVPWFARPEPIRDAAQNTGWL
jgi:hypothetical protein